MLVVPDPCVDLRVSPLIVCLAEADPFRTNPQLLAKLASAPWAGPWEVCVRLFPGPARGDNRLEPVDADVVLRRACKIFDKPSLGEPSGLGVAGRCVASSSWARLEIPDTSAVTLGSVRAVVGEAFAGEDESVKG